MITIVATFALRPAAQFPTNSPSCGNQPAHISLTARRTRHPNQEKDAAKKNRAGLQRIQRGGRPTHAHLTRRVYISVEASFGSAAAGTSCVVGWRAPRILRG